MSDEQHAPPSLDIDPATITRIESWIGYFEDGREHEGRDVIRDVITVGTAPDGTPVVILESAYDNERGEWTDPETGRYSEPKFVTIWSYPTIEDARADRDELMKLNN